MPTIPKWDSFALSSVLNSVPLYPVACWLSVSTLPSLGTSNVTFPRWTVLSVPENPDFPLDLLFQSLVAPFHLILSDTHSGVTLGSFLFFIPPYSGQLSVEPSQYSWVSPLDLCLLPLLQFGPLWHSPFLHMTTSSNMFFCSPFLPGLTLVRVRFIKLRSYLWNSPVRKPLEAPHPDLRRSKVFVGGTLHWTSQVLLLPNDSWADSKDLTLTLTHHHSPLGSGNSYTLQFLLFGN